MAPLDIRRLSPKKDTACDIGVSSTLDAVRSSSRAHSPTTSTASSASIVTGSAGLDSDAVMTVSTTRLHVSQFVSAALVYGRRRMWNVRAATLTTVTTAKRLQTPMRGSDVMLGQAGGTHTESSNTKSDMTTARKARVYSCHQKFWPLYGSNSTPSTRLASRHIRQRGRIIFASALRTHPCDAATCRTPSL
jgi:hypothetical protein